MHRRLYTTAVIGKNNIIGKNVKIMENVTIGDDNKFLGNITIYPNTRIGNKNIFLDGNRLGELPVHSGMSYDNFKFTYNGLRIGNDNIFHVDNKIFNGFDNETIIGNNCKFLAENHIGHDTIIEDGVVLYPRCITGGGSRLMSNSTMGFYSTIQQKKVLGSYAMIGAGNNASHNIFPFYIYFKNKYIRYNTMKIPKNINMENTDLKYLIDYIKKYSFDELVMNEINNLPESIKNPVLRFHSKLIDMKI